MTSVWLQPVCLPPFVAHYDIPTGNVTAYQNMQKGWKERNAFSVGQYKTACTFLEQIPLTRQWTNGSSPVTMGENGKVKKEKKKGLVLRGSCMAFRRRKGSVQTIFLFSVHMNSPIEKPKEGGKQTRGWLQLDCYGSGGWKGWSLRVLLGDRFGM